jgi:quercetin dioxygenase-like cupin family protein
MQYPYFKPKNWGSETIIVNNDKYCGKKMFIAKNCYCSFHYHIVKDETFYVSRGKLGVVIHRALHQNNELLTNGLLKNCKPHIYVEFDIFPHSTEICAMCAEYRELLPGDILHLPPFTIHRFYGFEDTTFYEFSTHDDPADSIRILPSCGN